MIAASAGSGAVWLGSLLSASGSLPDGSIDDALASDVAAPGGWPAFAAQLAALHTVPSSASSLAAGPVRIATDEAFDAQQSSDDPDDTDEAATKIPASLFTAHPAPPRLATVPPVLQFDVPLAAIGSSGAAPLPLDASEATVVRSLDDASTPSEADTESVSPGVRVLPAAAWAGEVGGAGEAQSATPADATQALAPNTSSGGQPTVATMATTESSPPISKVIGAPVISPMSDLAHGGPHAATEAAGGSLGLEVEATVPTLGRASEARSFVRATTHTTQDDPAVGALAPRVTATSGADTAPTRQLNSMQLGTSESLAAASTADQLLLDEAAQRLELAAPSLAQSRPEAPLHASPASRSMLQQLANSAPAAEVELQRGRDLRAPAMREWKFSASDVGQRIAAHPVAPVRADLAPVGSESAPSAAGSHGNEASIVAAVGGVTRSTTPFARVDAETMSDARTGAISTAQAPAAAADPHSKSSDRHPHDPPKDSAPTAPVAPSTAVATSGIDTLDANTRSMDLGARLRLAVADVIVDAGRDRLLDSLRTSFQARVTVSPAHLGSVQVHVTREVASNGLSILLVAAHQDAARALESEADGLIEDLVRHRLEVNELQVRRGEGNATEQQRDGQRSATQEQNARERREQQQAQQRADDRESDPRRGTSSRWERARVPFSEAAPQESMGSDRS